MSREHDKAEEVLVHLRLQGLKPRKVDDRYGGLPDYMMWLSLKFSRPPEGDVVNPAQFGGPWADSRMAAQRLIMFETKIISHEPPWTPAQLKLRPSQASFFRTWPGPAYVVAFQETKRREEDGQWWVAYHPDKLYWVSTPDPEVVARLLMGLAPLGGKRNSEWLTRTK